MPAISLSARQKAGPQDLSSVAGERVKPAIKAILVPIAGVEEDRAHLQAALGIARQFSAHLDVAHIRLDPARLAAGAASAAYGSAEFVVALYDQFEKDAQSCLAAAQATFAAFSKDEHLELHERADRLDAVTAAWVQETGDAGECVARLGRARDLLVVGRAGGPAGAATGTIETALMESGRPLLIVPPGISQIVAGTVAIAWKDSAEAARAVTAAMPFLALAERVVVIEVVEGTTADRKEGESSERLVNGLAWHGIKAEARLVRPGTNAAPDALLAAARDAGADLVVMGAYGHSRVREMIFGGFTRQILRAADLPVLMFH